MMNEFQCFQTARTYTLHWNSLQFSQPSPLPQRLSNRVPLLIIYKGQPIPQYLKHKEPFKESGLLFTIGKRYIKAQKESKNV